MWTKLLILFFSLYSSSLLANAGIFQELNSSLKLLIKKDDGKTYICSSVAITRTTLLTAAHCLENTFSIKVEINYDKTLLPIKSFAVHPSYNKSKSNFLFDIGIVSLGQKLPLQIKVKKILMNPDANLPLYRVGYGARDGKNEMTIIHPILNYSVKLNYIDALDVFSYSGDSGGPLFAEWNKEFYLIGIHSTKEGGLTFNPIINDEIIDWIIKSISN